VLDKNVEIGYKCQLSIITSHAVTCSDMTTSHPKNPFVPSRGMVARARSLS
jgi:hypothetical protein